MRTLNASSNVAMGSEGKDSLKLEKSYSLSSVVATCSSFSAATFIVIAQLLSEGNLWEVVVVGGGLVLANCLFTLLNWRRALANDPPRVAIAERQRRELQRRRTCLQDAQAASRRNWVELSMSSDDDYAMPSAEGLNKRPRYRSDRHATQESGPAAASKYMDDAKKRRRIRHGPDQETRRTRSRRLRRSESGRDPANILRASKRKSSIPASTKNPIGRRSAKTSHNSHARV
jgi:hypothetical protein